MAPPESSTTTYSLEELLRQGHRRSSSPETTLNLLSGDPAPPLEFKIADDSDADPGSLEPTQSASGPFRAAPLPEEGSTDVQVDGAAGAILVQDPGPPVPVDPGEASGEFDGLLISWQRGVSAEARERARSTLGLTLRETILTAAMARDGVGPIEVLDLGAGMAAEQAIEALGRRPDVNYAERNWLLTTQADSNDPYLTDGTLWGMLGEGGGSRAQAAWGMGHTGSSDIYIGVIDEGFEHDHADLAGNAGVNPHETADDGIDNDGNGYIDDVHGWDFVRNDATVFDGKEDDHGTHVAGTIGGVGNNGQGVAGVAWNVSLMGAKFLGRRGGSTADAIKAVDYFTDLKTRGVNIVATNNSWGGGGFSQGLYDAIQRANVEDILFVAAAGNSSTNSLSYPAAYGIDHTGYPALENVIAVASLDPSGALSSFSNYGSSWVHLAAPGRAITSTLPGDGYGSYSGTSMATPHVTGALALMAAAAEAAGTQVSAADLKQALLASTIRTGSLEGKTITGGRLAVDLAIANLLGQSSATEGGSTEGSSSEPIMEAPAEPDPTVPGETFWGTADNDPITGSDGDDRIAGVPAPDQGVTNNQVDELTGGLGNDVFLLADGRNDGTLFYDDGIREDLGTSDHARIMDFERGVDKLQLLGGLSYVYSVDPSTSSLTLYWDRNGNGTINGNGRNQDEMIAELVGVDQLSMDDLVVI